MLIDEMRSRSYHIPNPVLIEKTVSVFFLDTAVCVFPYANLKLLLFTAGWLHQSCQRGRTVMNFGAKSGDGSCGRQNWLARWFPPSCKLGYSPMTTAWTILVAGEPHLYTSHLVEILHGNFGR